MEAGDLVLGIDVATAAVRVTAVEVATGEVVAQTDGPLPAPISPRPGELEQEPAYARAVRSGVATVTGELGVRASAVRALAVTATSGSVVAAGADGVPRGPALLYADQRATTQAARLSAATGRTVGTSSTAARLAWLAERERTGPSPTTRYLHVPDVVVADLTGRLVTDTSHALKVGIDPVTARWPADLLAAAGIPLGALPDLVHPGTVVGVVRSAAATELGLPPDVLVVAGMTDGSAAQIATGAVAPGRTAGVLGTTLVLKGASTEEVAGFGGAVYSHLGPDGVWWPGGASNTGAGILSGEADLPAADAAAAALGPSGLVGYPLPGTGERFPFSRPDATGFLLGGETATPAERHRARLDGVAYVERLGLDRMAALGVASTDHRVAGGGARSTVWTTIRASVLNRPVSRSAQPSSAFGAAVLAAAALTGDALTPTAARLVRAVEVVDPDPGQVDALEAGYCRLLAELRDRGWLDDAAGSARPPTPPHGGDR